MGDLDLPVHLDHLQRERVRVVGLRLLHAARDDLDQHVGVEELLRQLEFVGPALRVELDRGRRVRANVRELPARAAGLDERIAAEQQLDVHLVVVHRAAGQVLVVQRDRARLDLQIEARLGCRQRGLLLRAVLVVDHFGRLALDLIKLVEHVEETLAPLVDRMVLVARRDLPRQLGRLVEEVEIRPEVIVLQPRVELALIHAGEETDRLLHAPLQQHVVRHRHQVVVVQLTPVRQHLHQAQVLLAEPLVDDLPLVAQLVRPGVDQRIVLHDLVGLAEHWVDRQQHAVQVHPALRNEAALVLEILADGGGGVVLHAIRPQHLVVRVPLQQHREGAAEEARVLDAPRDTGQVDATEVLLLEEVDRLRVAAVLRQVVPARLVDLAEFGDDVERDRLGRRDQVAMPRHVHRIVRPILRRGEVEVVLQRLRVVRLEVDVTAAGVLPVGDRDGALGNLHQHVQLLARRRRVRDDHLTAVHDVRQELLGDVLVQLHVVHVPVPVAVTEEVLADQDRRLVRRGGGRTNLAVEDHHRAACFHRERPSLKLPLMLGGIEGQVQHGQREHHLREAPRRLGEVGGEEWPVPVVLGVVQPEAVDGHQRGVLLLDGQVVVVVLDPLLRLVELAVELADIFQFREILVVVVRLPVGGAPGRRGRG